MRGKSKRASAGSTVVSEIVCYCNGARELGTTEVFCNSCCKWFHARCLKDLLEFYGIPFMICYVFNCKDCSPSKEETWIPKQANFVHMCVTVLANLTAEKLKADGKLEDSSNTDMPYFDLYSEIIPYVEENWESLTSMVRRVKNTWHNTIQKTLCKEPDLFSAIEESNKFSLCENLVDLGPANDAVKNIGVRKVEKGSSSVTAISAPSTSTQDKAEEDGPKTRGASKRRNVDSGGNTTKKSKLATDYSSAKISGQESAIDFPFNKEGYSYFLVEEDPNILEKGNYDENETSALTIPSHSYRLVNPDVVTVSPNDRAYQLRVADDHQTVFGSEGYCMARGTHSVSKGTWYFEVQFLKQPPDSHIRIGWSQRYAVVQACAGYNKFSYGWRSHKGTKFHDACGKSYYKNGYKEGDVLGLLIHLPHNESDPNYSDSYITPSRKDNHLINFKHKYFFESHDETAEIVKQLKPLPGSKIEFFHNGKSCGVAFEDIYAGFYYPTVSLFGPASVRLNFGPKFRYLPKDATPMSHRPAEAHVEQSLSDILYIVDKNLC